MGYLANNHHGASLGQKSPTKEEGERERMAERQRSCWEKVSMNVPCRGLTRVSTGLGTLGTYDIRSHGAGFGDVFRMPDHVHVQDTVGVEFLDDVLRCDAHSGHEQFRAARDDDVDQCVEVAFGVVGLEGTSGSACLVDARVHAVATVDTSHGGRRCRFNGNLYDLRWSYERTLQPGESTGRRQTGEKGLLDRPVRNGSLSTHWFHHLVVLARKCKRSGP